MTTRTKVALGVVAVVGAFVVIAVTVWWVQRADVRAAEGLVESGAEAAGVDGDELTFASPIVHDIVCPEEDEDGERTELTGFVRRDLRERATVSADRLADDGWEVYRLVGTGERSDWLLVEARRDGDRLTLSFRSDSLWVTAATESCGQAEIEFPPRYEELPEFPDAASG